MLMNRIDSSFNIKLCVGLKKLLVYFFIMGSLREYRSTIEGLEAFAMKWFLGLLLVSVSFVLIAFPERFQQQLTTRQTQGGVKVLQGEREMAGDNKLLGEFDFVFRIGTENRRF
ncbi:hypothetical protein Dimus_017540 [Dionaea muscipula]